MKRTLLTLLAATIAVAGWAISRQALVSYASSLQGLKGAALKAQLHTIMQPTTILDYGSGSGATWSGFYQTDRDPETNECYNRYSSQKFYFTSSTSAPSGMNIEHSFPKSWWGGTKNNAYKDLYHLYPTDASANSDKSNYAMGVVTNVKSSEEGYDKVGTGTINGVSGVSCWEPGDQYKGDFARSYMYMAIVYSNLTFVKVGLQTMANEDYPGLKSWASSLYIAWGKQDLVDALERNRNNAVAKIEGNRNLLVDYPYLADYVWGDSTDVAFDPTTSITTADDDDRYMTTQPVDPDTPDTPSTEKYQFEKVTDGVEDGGEYLIVADASGTLKAAKTVNNGSKKFGYLYVANVTDVNNVITMTTDTLTFTLEANSGGYLLKDYKGRYLYQTGTYPNYNYTTSASTATPFTFTLQSDGTFKIMNSAGYYVQYSTKYGSYGCYTTSSGVLPMLYKKKTDATGITAPATAEPTTQSQTVYTLQGQAVGTSLDALPKGIYILGGKKILVR